jgi:fatty acid desaturase
MPGVGSTGASEAHAAPKGEEFRLVVDARLPPKLVKDLTRISPLRSTLAILQTFGLIAAIAALPQIWPYPAVYAACVFLMASQQHALAILSHEAVHYRLYDDRRLNDGFGKLAGWMVSVSMLSYRIVHRLHHNHLYERIDPDLPLQAGYPRGRGYLVKRLAKDLFGLTTIKNYAYFYGRPGTNTKSQEDDERIRALIDDTSPALKRAAARDRIVAILFQIVVLAVATATGYWIDYLVLWALPLVTIFQVLLRFRAIAEHGAVPDPTNVRKATRTTLTPWWIRWMVFPHNVNYHIEHHLYPSIPQYRLRAAHKALAQIGALDGAEVCSLGAAWRKFFAAPEKAPA